MLKVLLTSFFFIILAELALHTVLLLGKLDFGTYALFGTLKLHYECGRVVRVLDSGSDVRGFDRHHRRYFFSVLDSFLITAFMNIFPSKYFINRVIEFMYIFYNRKSCTNLR